MLHYSQRAGYHELLTFDIELLAHQDGGTLDPIRSVVSTDDG